MKMKLICFANYTSRQTEKAEYCHIWWQMTKHMDSPKGLMPYINALEDKIKLISYIPNLHYTSIWKVIKYN
jgi:hypothetical protein